MVNLFTRMREIIKNKIWPIALMLFFFFLPFERIPTAEFFGFTLKISYILALLVIILFLAANPLRFLKKIPLSKSDWLLLAFFASSAISTFLFSPHGRSYIILALWGFVFLLYLILERAIENLETREKIENAVLIVSLIISVFGLFQFVADSLGLSQSITGLRFEYTKAIMAFPRVQSVALEPLYFANFLIFPLFMAIKKYMLAEKPKKSYFWLMTLIFALITLTVSRGAFLAVAISLSVLFIFLFLQKQKALRQKAAAIVISLAVAVLFAFGLIYLLDGPKALNTFLGHSIVENVANDGSSFNRITTYQQSLSLFSENIWLGRGVGSFGILTTPAADIETKGYATVNNEYLEILAETGAIGFILFVLFLVYFSKEIYVKTKKMPERSRIGIFALTLAALAIIIQYNFFSTLYIIYIWAFLALLKSEVNLAGEK